MDGLLIGSVQMILMISSARVTNLHQKGLACEALQEDENWIYAAVFLSLSTIAPKESLRKFMNEFSEIYNAIVESDKNTAPGNKRRWPTCGRGLLGGEQKLYTPTGTTGYCVIAYLPNPDQNGKLLELPPSFSPRT
jgi:hypothetical protein